MPKISKQEARKYNLLTAEAASRNYYARDRNPPPRPARPRREPLVARLVDPPTSEKEAIRHLDYLKGVRDGAYMMIDNKVRSFGYVQQGITSKQLISRPEGASNADYHDLKHTEKFLVADHAYNTYRAQLLTKHSQGNGAQR